MNKDQFTLAYFEFCKDLHPRKQIEDVYESIDFLWDKIQSRLNGEPVSHKPKAVAEVKRWEPKEFDPMFQPVKLELEDDEPEQPGVKKKSIQKTESGYERRDHIPGGGVDTDRNIDLSGPCDNQASERSGNDNAERDSGRVQNPVVHSPQAVPRTRNDRSGSEIRNADLTADEISFMVNLCKRSDLRQDTRPRDIVACGFTDVRTAQLGNSLEEKGYIRREKPAPRKTYLFPLKRPDGRVYKKPERNAEGITRYEAMPADGYGHVNLDYVG